ncbi:elongation factor G [Clostridium felsineum]|uniref:elongation factor G n=1 Tax=Clostridium felsineum TaxID=36839 RepID=UPI00098BD291|nr:TetM/TetW/TetO/TetS family tetracycline resistance ribosomal protection protein [Clostridium felsineum]URZ17395.1 Tetracycline resistance protein TetM from transposon TnFO1 [Clostridium felsineum DSM 794]
MNKTIGLLAHVDAGKTTLAEQILYHTKSIRKRGRVDHKDSFLDNSSVEKERGITVFSEQAVFEFKDSKYFLVDTPGHMDFSPEMERAIEVMDYAVLIISGVDGVQSQTENIWTILRKHNIPTIFFINKMDRVNANKENVIKEIKDNFTENIFCISEGELSEEVIEFIAEKDDDVCEAYLTSGYEKELWFNSMKKLIKKSKIFPCFMGSALEDSGIEVFLDGLHNLTYTEYNAVEKFVGLVYKIRYDETRNKIIHIKALKGSLKVKQEVIIKNQSNKINEIRFYNGNKYTTAGLAEAGEIFAAIGIKEVKVGDFIGNNVENIKYNMIPTLKSKVIFDEKLNSNEVFEYFKILEEEEPSLNVLWNEKLKSLEIHVMGKIELEILKTIVMERFKLKVDFGACEVLYKETITKKANGYGHFEPLRHYAEVCLELEPAPLNSGITFKSKCKTESLTIGEQNLVKTHIFEREHHGILIGASVTDINIILIDGRHHIKHTSGGDFREATLRALRQGLESTDNILLEPFYDFRIEVNIGEIGRVISDINKMSGEFYEPQMKGDTCIIKGKGPVVEFMDYPSALASFTKGRGKISLAFSGYEKCHNSEEVISSVNYNKYDDIEYTSTSIFCSKGQAYEVKGSEVVNFMHSLK